MFPLTETEFTERLADLVDGLETLAAIDTTELSARERSAAIRSVVGLESKLVGLRSALVGEYVHRQNYRTLGHLHPTRGIADAAGVDETQARGFVWLAKRLPDLPATSHALSAGTISEDHARAIARGLEAFAKAADPDAVEQAFVEIARHTTAKQVRRLVSDLRAALGLDKETRYELRSVTLDATTGMWMLGGHLDPEVGQLMKRVLDAIMTKQRDVDGEKRTMQQRRHDALEELMRRAANDQSLPNVRGVRPRLYVHIREAIDDHATPVAVLENGIRLASEAMRRILCDCELGRAIINQRSIPLDMGRAVRTATDTQFRALVIRDHGCVICAATPDNCEAHHLTWWEHDGPTDLNNLCLVCWRCHRLIHDGKWTLHIETDRTTHLTRPDGSRAPPIPQAA